MIVTIVPVVLFSQNCPVVPGRQMQTIEFASETHLIKSENDDQISESYEKNKILITYVPPCLQIVGFNSHNRFGVTKSIEFVTKEIQQNRENVLPVCSHRGPVKPAGQKHCAPF